MLLFKLITVFLFILGTNGIENGECLPYTMDVYRSHAHIHRSWFLAVRFFNTSLRITPSAGKKLVHRSVKLCSVFKCYIDALWPMDQCLSMSPSFLRYIIRGIFIDRTKHNSIRCGSIGRAECQFYMRADWQRDLHHRLAKKW